MKLSFVNGLRAGEELEFAIPEITVGRELDNLVNIPVEGVSRYHGKFCQQPNGVWTVEDTGSTNGIKLNKVKIQARQELHEGDLVEFGNQMIRVSGLSAGPAPVVLSFLDEQEISPVGPAEVSIAEPEPLPPPPPARIQLDPEPMPAAGKQPIRREPRQDASPGKSAQELSEALKNGKLHLFSGKNNSDPLAEAPGAPEGSKRKQTFSLLLFYTLVICLVIMGIASYYALQTDSGKKAQVPQEQLDKRNAKKFLLYYEKNIVTPNNVFFFVLHVENGEARFQIDDLQSSRSYVRTGIPFSPESYETFRSELEQEGFFRTKSPEAAPDQGAERDYRRMVVCDQGRLHEINVRNNMRPGAFESMENVINLFAENHALRTVSMTPEELQEQAAQNFYKAEELFQNRESRPANLRSAIHRYRLTVEYLDAFVPKPQLWDRARKQLDAAQDIRKERIAALKSERVRLAQLREFASILPILDEIMALSDPDSPDFSDARRQRIRIDSFLREQGGHR